MNDQDRRSVTQHNRIHLTHIAWRNDSKDVNEKIKARLCAKLRPDDFKRRIREADKQKFKAKYNSLLQVVAVHGIRFSQPCRV